MNGMATLDQDLRMIARDCVGVRVRKLNRLVTRLYDEAFAPLGVKVSQLNVLVATGVAGVIRPSQLCQALALDESTVSRNVDRLRSRGWVETFPDADDARVQPIRLTDAGRELLRQALPLWKLAQKRAEELLGDDGKRGLFAAVTRARELLD